MHILDSIAAVRGFRKQHQNHRLALVPTMGNLHAGHVSLIERAKQHADQVICSIFVNPSQFGPKEDFSAYPRTLEADCSALSSAGCDAVFTPSVPTMYPGLFSENAGEIDVAGRSEATNVTVRGISEIFCGIARPGHFSGVATVVAKLFNLVQPDVAIFGAKDFQQVVVIKTMVRELNFPIEIVTAPTIREANGLARSSRNQYLTEQERRTASVIYATLLQMRDSFFSKENVNKIEDNALTRLVEAGLQPDYVVLRDAQTLDLIRESTREVVALLAARLGRARLIDNLSFAVNGA